MSSQQNSNRVVELSEYRAARAARTAQAVAPAPYLLWYPGLGYVQVGASVTPSGLPVGGTPPRY
jgi:hypothetical protein